MNVLTSFGDISMSDAVRFSAKQNCRSRAEETTSSQMDRVDFDSTPAWHRCGLHAATSGCLCEVATVEMFCEALFRSVAPAEFAGVQIGGMCQEVLAEIPFIFDISHVKEELI